MAWSVVSVDGLGRWYYRRGLVTFARAAVAVIAAPTTGPTPLGRMLAWSPLRGLGVISYGVYLWHWPVDVYLTAERTSLDGRRLDLVRIGVTRAVARASFVVEQPIRRDISWKPGLRGWRSGPVAVAAAVASLAAVLLATTGTPAPPPTRNGA